MCSAISFVIIIVTRLKLIIESTNYRMTSKQLQHKFQSARKRRSDVETANADRIKQ